LNSEKSSEVFYTIGEVSEKTGIKPYILRYWEKEFPFLQPIKNKAGHRLYTKRDIFIIDNIKALLYRSGYSIQGAKKVMWEILLGEKSSNVNPSLEEIKNDLREVLAILRKSLASDL